MSAEADDFNSGLDLLADQCRFSGYLYALTDINGALIAWMADHGGATAIPIGDVIGITSTLSAEAQKGGNTMESRI